MDAAEAGAAGGRLAVKPENLEVISNAIGDPPGDPAGDAADAAVSSVPSVSSGEVAEAAMAAAYTAVYEYEARVTDVTHVTYG